MTNPEGAAMPRKLPWWKTRITRLVLSCIVAAGGLLVGVAQFNEELGLGTWMAWPGLASSFFGGVWLALTNQSKKGTEELLYEEAAKAKLNGYQGAASTMRPFVEKQHTHIGSRAPEVGDILRGDAVEVARVFLNAIGVEKVRVSYYTPTAAEDGPDVGQGGEQGFSALTLVNNACSDGRHKPRPLHKRSPETEHMFSALNELSPISPPPRRRGKMPRQDWDKTWKSARQVAVRSNDSEPLGLLSADSTSKSPFPSQADDILALVVELLLLAQKTTQYMSGKNEHEKTSQTS